LPKARFPASMRPWFAVAPWPTVRSISARETPFSAIDAFRIALETSDLPVGMFASGDFSATELSLDSGDGILIYSYGVSDATDASGQEYGVTRLRTLVGEGRAEPEKLLAACREDLTPSAGARRWTT
jgi:serine phosphatase RsbU (regulator of sigma subunit)